MTNGDNSGIPAINISSEISAWIEALSSSSDEMLSSDPVEPGPPDEERMRWKATAWELGRFACADTHLKNEWAKWKGSHMAYLSTHEVFERQYGDRDSDLLSLAELTHTLYPETAAILLDMDELGEPAREGILAGANTEPIQGLLPRLRDAIYSAARRGHSRRWSLPDLNDRTTLMHELLHDFRGDVAAIASNASMDDFVAAASELGRLTAPLPHEEGERCLEHLIDLAEACATTRKEWRNGDYRIVGTFGVRSDLTDAYEERITSESGGHYHQIFAQEPRDEAHYVRYQEARAAYERASRAALERLYGGLLTTAREKALAADLAKAAAAEQARTEEAERAEVAAEAMRVQRERILNRPAPAPPPQKYGVSHTGAEALVADWMRHLGVLDAAVTRAVKDGGLDVNSETYVVQVKNYQGSVSVTEVRELYGVANSLKKKPLLFTSGTLTEDAATFAGQVDIPVIRYSAEQGTITGLNELGRACVEFGIIEGFQQPSSHSSSEPR